MVNSKIIRNFALVIKELLKQLIMVLNEVINTIDEMFNTCGIVRVNCTLRLSNGKLYDTNIIVANCNDDEFEDYYGHIVAPNQHWTICCGLDNFKDECNYAIGSAVLCFNSVEKFITDF